MNAIFPLTHCLLPGDAVSLRIFEQRYVRMFSDLVRESYPTFASVLIERGSEVGGGDRRFSLGVEVENVGVTFDGNQLLVTGTAGRVVEVMEWWDDAPYPQGSVVIVEFPEPSRAKVTDAASAITVLAQSLRSLLARHGVGVDDAPHPAMTGLSTVASGRWFTSHPEFRDVQTAFWAVCRCVPCGPLDRHAFLRADELDTRVIGLRRTIEHADEILGFSFRGRP